jgi:hypothetical protein
LSLGQREPSFGQNEPRPSVLAIFAAVCLAQTFSCFKATVVAFGHLGNDDSERLPIPFMRSELLSKDQALRIAVNNCEVAGAIAEGLTAAGR